jgi:colanic acid/amylovoran biosynthesis glycosyltransferase
MKVLFWISKFPAFSETFIRDQIVSLLDQGVDVTIYTKNGKINIEELEALSGFEAYQLLDRVVDVDLYFETNRFKRLLKLFHIFFSVLFSKNFKYYKESLSIKKFGSLARSLRLFFRVHFFLRNNINVVHAHYGPNGNSAVVLKEIGLPINLFTTFHGYDIRLGLTNGGHIYKPLFEHADGILAISKYNFRKLLDFGASKTKLIFLPNGINISLFKQESSNLHKGVLKILTVARLVEEKSLDVAIKALYEVLRSHPDLVFEYTIVGEGEKRLELQNLITSLGLIKDVKLVGAQSSLVVRDLMSQSDLFLLSSQAEALPTVLLEAQASEMILLATDVGSVRDIVVGGLVVASKDVHAFKNGLLELLDKRDYWAVLAKKGSDFVGESHNIKEQTKKLISYYEN